MLRSGRRKCLRIFPSHHMWSAKRYLIGSKVCGASEYEGHKSEHLQGPKARSPAKATGPSMGKAGRVKCNTVAYTSIIEWVVQVMQEYAGDQKSSEWQASVHWLLHFTV